MKFKIPILFAEEMLFDMNDIHSKPWSEIERDELYEIIKLRNQVFMVDQQCNYFDLDDLDQQSHHIWLEEEGKVIAYIRIIDLGTTYELGRLCVEKDYRNQGLAKQFMDLALQWVMEHPKYDQVNICSHETLAEYYKSWGFITKNEAYLYNGMWYQDMYLDLCFTNLN